MMKAKSFLVSGIAAGIVNFLLGWVFYDQLFPDIYQEDGNTNMLFIFLGCMTFGLFMAYAFTVLASINNARDGLKSGAVFGLFYALSMNLFMYSSMEANYQNMAIDVAINMVMAAIMGGIIAVINGKMK